MSLVASGRPRPQINGVLRSTLTGMAVLTALASGCAGKESGPAEPAQSPSAPRAARWDGIYQGPYHLYLRIETNGDQAVGTWRALGERNGELKGEIDGDTLTFDWTEQASDGTWSGRGSFVFGYAKTGGRAELRGHYGLGTRSTGGSWYASKRPDLPLDTKASLLLDAGADDGPDQRANCQGGCDEVEIGEE
jgi:hypothetical protein